MKERNLVAVIDTMLAAIPTEQTVLRAQLVSVRKSVPYTAPEVMSIAWQRVAQRLEAHGVSAETEWGAEVLRVWSGQVKW